MSEHEGLISEFQNITGQSDGRSRFFLESAGWKLDIALSTFYQEAEEVSGGDDVNDDSDLVDVVEHRTPNDRPAVSHARQTRSSAGRTNRQGNIATLANSDKHDSAEDSDDSESGQAFFAGSGQQILGPGRDQRHAGGESFVNRLFDTLKKKSFSNESGSQSSSSAGAVGESAFSGRAFRLGSASDSAQTDGQSSSVPTTDSNSGGSRQRTRNVMLNLWANGFSLDDGELRTFDSAESRQFMADIMAGKIPEELVGQADGELLHVNIKDCRSEQYQVKKKSVTPFQGRGHTLGGIVPKMDDAESENIAKLDWTELESEAKAKIQFTEDEELTSVQVRFPDRSIERLVCRLNHNRHTVADLRQYIQIARPAVQDRPFSLNLTFPNRKLVDDAQTVRDAGLAGACVMLRFV